MMNPSYDPGFGRVPVKLTVTLFRCPAVKVKLDGVTRTLAFESGSRCCTAKVMVAEDPPVLVMFRVLLMGREPAAMTPNSKVAGSNVAATLTEIGRAHVCT